MSPRDAVLAFLEDNERIPLEGVKGAFIKRLSVEQIQQMADTPPEVRMPTIFAMAVCDETGKRIFTDSDVDILRKTSALKFSELNTQVARFNRIGEQAATDAEKNSDETPSEG